MNKWIRNGIDVEVAFTSSARRMAAIAGSPSEQAVALASKLSAQGMSSTQQDYSSGSRVSNKIKAFLRPGVRAIYRALIPFLRPVAFRIRAYFFALPKIDQDHSAILAELNAIKNDLRAQKDSRRADINRLDRIEQYAIASARRFVINWGPGEILVRSEIGYLFCAPSDHTVLALLMDAGEMKQGIRLLIQSFLNPNDVFIDVGANVGMHTLAAAQAMQGRGRIIAFEPFGPTQRLLTKSIQMNGFAGMTEIHQAAVSNRGGHRSLLLETTSGCHSLIPLPTTSSLAAEAIEVALVRLDNVIPGETKVDLIKIDVEGAEIDVLESAKSIIASNPAIALVVQFGFPHLARAGLSMEDWLAAFHGVGLVHRAINRDTGRLEDWPVAQLEAADSVNLFFARPKSPAWTKAGMIL